MADDSFNFDDFDFGDSGVDSTGASDWLNGVQDSQLESPSWLDSLGDIGGSIGDWATNNKDVLGGLAGVAAQIYGANKAQDQFGRMAQQAAQISDPFYAYRQMLAPEMMRMWTEKEKSPFYQAQQQSLGALSNLVQNYYNDPKYTSGTGPFYY